MDAPVPVAFLIFTIAATVIFVLISVALAVYHIALRKNKYVNNYINIVGIYCEKQINKFANTNSQKNIFVINFLNVTAIPCTNQNNMDPKIYFANVFLFAELKDS